MKFTAHNVLLNNQQKTMGDETMLLADSAVWSSIEKTLDLFLPASENDRSKLRVVDLGCLEGGYAAEFARMGFDSLGIEARKENIDKCNYVKEQLGLSNLNFAEDDVRNMAKYGQFDVTLCYGLLYHLNDPVEFLKLVSKCTNKVLLLNTHFAPERDFRYNLGALNKYFIAPIQKRAKFLMSRQNYRLSPITENEGYKGRWFKEWTPGTKREKIEKGYLWASWNNHRSFWLTKKELTKALHDAGFTSVFEQFDYTGDLFREDYTEFHSRTMFVAVKH